MAFIVSVPLNTMLADLDEALRTLLRRELGRHGFDGVDIAFEAPAREWSGQLSGPAVSMFLYDLRESPEQRRIEWGRVAGANGSRQEIRPPMIMECSYAVTAWTEAVEDEHRLLSQVLAVLFAYPELPADAMTGRLAGLAGRHPIEGRIAQTKADGKADFWNAVGGQYKASLDYVVTIACESGSAVQRGPEVATQTLGIRASDGPASAVTELHRLTGSVTGSDGRPEADAWVALPDLGLLASSRADGRFVFDRVPAGTQRVVARLRDGGEAEQDVTVPGGRAILAIEPVKGSSAKD